ncbi:MULTISPECIES: T9SS type A sorting domain-containing protein [unclassified Chryseobacterium]|uniref:T9SS type A sorting domain-containing protein n=1 Tax=unclassified Chryseobacterium TaxID=2593645 RepID=UPI000D7752C5|nr:MULTISPECIES: T9SS type A sorting domain-containing protein [unclassified Chryseobacterium]PXW18150.1 putative secreted protein (Por secretion system target) [Chryseobacterium sp. CBTAP 102]
MKKYYQIAFLLSSLCVFAQQTISFEPIEGFSVGDINGQAGWISTPTGGVPENVTHQTINSDKASDGNRSLRIVKENTYGTQNDPVIGGFYNLSTPLAYNNFSVSFDINMSQLNGSDFGFQGVNNTDDEFVVRLDFGKTGWIKVLDMLSGIQNLISTPSAWLPNTWYRLKVVGSATDVRYYLNNILIYTGSAANSLNINQLRFVHNNSLGSAYVDNIKINSEAALSVKDAVKNDIKLSIYPNPATDIVKITTPNKIKHVEVYDMSGKRVDATFNGDQVNVSRLAAGAYLLNVETEGRNFTEKFIKK